MKNTYLIEVIAEQHLSLTLDDGRVEPVAVKIGKPRHVKKGGSYRCDFQIIGLDCDAVRYAEGADSVQALMLALLKIGSLLYTSEAFRSDRLTLLGGRNLGFPKFVGDDLSGSVPEPVGLLSF